MTQGPADYKRHLGTRLAQLMKDAGVSKLAVATELECSESKIARILRGGAGVNPSDLDKLLTFLKVSTAMREELTRLGKEASRRQPPTPWGSAVPDSLRKYFPTEATATLIRAYNPELVHGLAQTEDYARAMITASPLHRPADVPRLIQARMARQVRLSGPNPPRLHLVLSEACVRGLPGGTEVMREQLRHLVELGDLDHVAIQVIAREAGAHSASGFSFTLFSPPEDKVVAYVENPTDGIFISEAGRLESYELIWASLVDSALSPEESSKLLVTVEGQL
ncbi:helix-turn-helix transcriptional regulator [Umezawaea sp. Da 62-37]|uniref:helix-turn-helix domain-containing protein n=1 Tax=Umezawaea sp. Da 62-37 TaxID=3075927 RepID=UPI0028F73337|nr:helix-turn-helix transcriptional regulator [Umezawaea sp. Da 62-37]WNV91683.1 helix-turn-helix transcriptional regulator [Umezawaea sp. Da 62-37]